MLLLNVIPGFVPGFDGRPRVIRRATALGFATVEATVPGRLISPDATWISCSYFCQSDRSWTPTPRFSKMKTTEELGCEAQSVEN